MSAKGKKLSLPAMSQVGIVVKDLDKAMDYYATVFGVGPFNTFQFNPEKHWVRGKIHPVSLKVALAPMGQVEFELIEPLSDSPHREFLESYGEGLHHIGFVIDDYDEWMDYLKAQNIEILCNAELDAEGMGHVRAAYIDLQQGNPANLLVEIIEVKPFE